MGMLDKDDQGYISETGNWNVAGEYARTKIMKPLWLADEYELIAIFGTTDFVEELNFNFSVDYLKIKGFKRLVNSLIMLINNSYFAVKEKRGRPELMKLKEELERIDKIIPRLYVNKVNQLKKTREVRLDEKKYQEVLEKVINIKSKINEPLNRNHLIFVDRKEFDPTDFKEGIKDRMINRG